MSPTSKTNFLLLLCFFSLSNAMESDALITKLVAKDLDILRQNTITLDLNELSQLSDTAIATLYSSKHGLNTPLLKDFVKKFKQLEKKNAVYNTIFEKFEALKKSKLSDEKMSTMLLYSAICCPNSHQAKIWKEFLNCDFKNYQIQSSSSNKKKHAQRAKSLLLSTKLNLFNPCFDGSLVKLAIEKENIPLCKVLQDNAVSLEGCYYNGQTIFHDVVLIRTSLIEDILNLIFCGVNPTCINEDGQTILMLAAQRNWFGCIKQLLGKHQFDSRCGFTSLREKFDLDKKDNTSKTALDYSVSGKFVGISNYLLKKGANPTELTVNNALDMATSDIKTPINAAVNAINFTILEMIYQHHNASKVDASKFATLCNAVGANRNQLDFQKLAFYLNEQFSGMELNKQKDVSSLLDGKGASCLFSLTQ